MTVATKDKPSVPEAYERVQFADGSVKMLRPDEFAKLQNDPEYIQIGSVAPFKGQEPAAQKTVDMVTSALLGITGDISSIRRLLETQDARIADLESKTAKAAKSA